MGVQIRKVTTITHPDKLIAKFINRQSLCQSKNRNYQKK
jgi:hypothetical protein